MAQFGTDSHWRDSGRRTRFWMFDSEACFPILLLLLHIKLWTFLLALGTVIFLSALNRRGLSVIIFGRLLRNFLAGNRKLAKPWWV